MSTTLSPPAVDSATGSAGRRPLIPGAAAPLVDRLLRTRTTTVRAVRAETPTIRVLELEPPPRFDNAAGQFVVLRLETDEGPDLRPLSIASAPGEASVHLATRLGPSAFKRAVFALEPGATVRISRPMGRFRLDAAHPAVIVTGGIGIAPIRSMLRDALAGGYDNPIRLLFSNRNAEDVPYRDDLIRLAAAYPNLEITWVVSEGGRSSAGAGVHVGHVDDHLLAPHVAELPSARFYLTGPAPMVSAMRDVLRRSGVPGRRIRSTEQTLPIDRLARRSH